VLAASSRRSCSTHEWVPRGKSIDGFREALHEKLRQVGSTKTRVLPGERGLGERFYVAEYIDTPFTLILDDDKTFTCADIHKFLLAARLFPRRIISVHENRRTIRRCVDGTKTTLYYGTENDSDQDNIALTSAALMSTSLLLAYMKLVPRPVIDLINRERNCEDMLFNWLTAYISGDEQEACVIVEDSSLYGFDGGKESLSWRGDHMPKRDGCLNLLREVFPDWPIPRPSSFRVRVE